MNNELNNSILEYDKAIGDLEAIVAETRKFTDIDIDNKEHMEEVKNKRAYLVKLRRHIEETGKKHKEEALATQRYINGKQKEYIAILTPEEERFKGYEAEAKLKEEMRKREKELPLRHLALDAIGDGIEITNEELLKMDSVAFNEYKNERSLAHVQAENEKIEKQKRDMQEQQDRIDAQKRELEEKQKEAERKEEIEKARLQGIEDEKKRAQEKAIEDEAKAKAKKLQDEADAEAKRKQDEERLAKDKEYQTFIESIGYEENNAPFYIKMREGGKIRFYQQIVVITE